MNYYHHLLNHYYVSKYCEGNSIRASSSHASMNILPYVQIEVHFFVFFGALARELYQIY